MNSKKKVLRPVLALAKYFLTYLNACLANSRQKKMKKTCNCNWQLFLDWIILFRRLQHTLNSTIYPLGIYLFKVKNGNTRTICEICAKLTIKATCRSGVVPLVLSMSRFHTLF